MIRMWCDRCEKEIPRDQNGAVRITVGKKKEITVHLCNTCQEGFEESLASELAYMPRVRTL